MMNQFIKQGVTAAILGLILFAVQLFAFSEPSSPPPGANTPAPLHVGAAGQTKTGGLILNTGGASYGLIVDQGSVGIGTQSPSQKLDVIGYIRGATGLCIGNDCRTGWPATYTPTCPSGYADAGDYCIEQNKRSPADWWNATATCRRAGAQLCTLVQWHPACVDGVASGMTSSSEWVGDMAYWGYTFHAAFMNSCSTGTVTPPYAQNHNFRCCVNK